MDKQGEGTGLPCLGCKIKTSNGYIMKIGLTCFLKRILLSSIILIFIIASFFCYLSTRKQINTPDKFEVSGPETPGGDADIEDADENCGTLHKCRLVNTFLFNVYEKDWNNNTEEYRHIRRGDEYYSQGNFDKAVEIYMEALKINPCNDELYLRFGDIYLRKNLKDEAAVEFKKAIEINNNNKYAYFGMADISIERGHYQKAEKYLKKSLEIDPNFAVAYTTLGDMYVDMERYEEAAEAFKHSLKVDPLQKFPDTYIGLGELYYLKGDYKSALDNFEIAQKKDPSDIDGFFGAARTAIKLKQFDKAAACFEICRKMSPDHLEAGSECVAFFIHARKYQEAETMLSYLLKKYPKEVRLLDLQKTIREKSLNESGKAY